MIPKKIHYVWIGGHPFPELVQQCLASWRKFMPEPEWSYRLWNENTIAETAGMASFEDVLAVWPLYVREAYAAGKYAFVSDYVRLWALEREGGLYMDVDFEVYKSFAPLLTNVAFVGREGSKREPPMLGVMATVAHGEWVSAMLHAYDSRTFIRPDGQYDLTTNVSYFAASDVHKSQWVKIYPVAYFCPVLTTGEDIRTENTYCEHRGLDSWSSGCEWKACLLRLFTPQIRTKLIKIKRKMFG
ncbi:MAG: glycosyl transferase [Paludibacteraceae bacterium]|nr:glycosyl transferase [Paludibacteraceae bacterium]